MVAHLFPPHGLKSCLDRQCDFIEEIEPRLVAVYLNNSVSVGSEVVI